MALRLRLHGRSILGQLNACQNKKQSNHLKCKFWKTMAAVVQKVVMQTHHKRKAVATQQTGDTANRAEQAFATLPFCHRQYTFCSAGYCTCYSGAALYKCDAKARQSCAVSAAHQADCTARTEATDPLGYAAALFNIFVIMSGLKKPIKS